MGYWQKQTENAVYVVRVPGPRAVQTGVASFLELLRPHLDRAKPRIILDLSEIEFMDSAFLGAMIMGLKRAVAQEGDLKVCGLQKPVQSIFNMLRLHRVFNVYETAEAARASFPKTTGSQ